MSQTCCQAHGQSLINSPLVLPSYISCVLYSFYISPQKNQILLLDEKSINDNYKEWYELQKPLTRPLLSHCMHQCVVLRCFLLHWLKDHTSIKQWPVFFKFLCSLIIVSSVHHCWCVPYTQQTKSGYKNSQSHISKWLYNGVPGQTSVDS